MSQLSQTLVLQVVFSVHTLSGKQPRATLNKHVNSVHTMSLRRTKRAGQFSAALSAPNLSGVSTPGGRCMSKLALSIRPIIGSLGCVTPLTFPMTDGPTAQTASRIGAIKFLTVRPGILLRDHDLCNITPCGHAEVPPASVVSGRSCCLRRAL